MSVNCHSIQHSPVLPRYISINTGASTSFALWAQSLVQEPLGSHDRYGVKESLRVQLELVEGEQEFLQCGLLPINIGSGAGAAGV